MSHYPTGLELERARHRRRDVVVAVLLIGWLLATWCLDAPQRASDHPVAWSERAVLP